MFHSNERFNICLDGDGVHPAARHCYYTCFIDRSSAQITDNEENRVKDQFFRELFVNALKQQSGQIPAEKAYCWISEDGKHLVSLDWYSLCWEVLDLEARGMAGRSWDKIKNLPGINCEPADYAAEILEPAIRILKNSELNENGEILFNGKTIDNGTVKPNYGIKHYVITAMKNAQRNFVNNAVSFLPSGLDRLFGMQRKIVKGAIRGTLTEKERAEHPILALRGSILAQKREYLDDQSLIESGILETGELIADPKAHEEYDKTEFWLGFEAAKSELETEIEKETFEVMFNPLCCEIKGTGLINKAKNKERAMCYLRDQYGLTKQAASRLATRVYRLGIDALRRHLDEELPKG